MAKTSETKMDSSKKTGEQKKETNTIASGINVDSSLKQLFISSIKDAYWSENHLVKSLPKMIDAAASPKLQKTIADHLEETKQHSIQLEKILKMMSEQIVAKKCDACEGLVLSGEHVIENTPEGTDVRDMGIIMSGLKVENFEITCYLGLIKTAKKLGENDVAKILENILKDEVAASEKLNALSDAPSKNK